MVVVSVWASYSRLAVSLILAFLLFALTIGLALKTAVFTHPDHLFVVPSSKSTFSQPFKENCISEAVGTGTRIIF